jgi:flagellar basal body-associated protein FliL
MVCLPCLAPIAAFAAAGGAASSTASDKDKKRSMIIYWISIGFLILTILVLIYFVFFKKGVCKSCISG